MYTSFIFENTSNEIGKLQTDCFMCKMLHELYERLLTFKTDIYSDFRIQFVYKE